MKNLDKRIQKLENELALLKADIKVKQEPIICSNPKMLFEVYPRDFGKMKWEDAMKACADLGDGWRLPTRLELLVMYNNQDELGGFASNYYWSSTESDFNNAWLQSFLSGNQFTFNKSSTYDVRAIKDIKK